MPADDHVTVTVETPAGAYTLEAEWLVCAEGAGSGTRKALGLDPPVVMFEDYWAIVDVRADLGHVQRRFWLDSPLLDGGAQIMHGMADGVVRTDWQISQFPDPDLEISPERVDERLRTILGPDSRVRGRLDQPLAVPPADHGPLRPRAPDLRG